MRLSQQVRIPGDRLDFRRGGPGWQPIIERPPVTRMEYLLEFRYYPRMVRFVASVPDGTVPAGRPVPTVLTCGAIEENVADNRLMTEALRARGHPAVLHEQPGLHNYTAWRDAFDPHLTRL